jgi:hypothetical protein
MMVLPKQETMRPGLLAKIKQLVRDGAIILGPPPTHSPSLQNQPLADQQVVSLASELWGDVDGINIKSRRYGKGVVMNGMDMKEAMALINCIPDCKLPEDSTIHYAHRKLGNGDIYFLSNQTNEEQVFTPEFRVTGMQPELWETTTGSIRKLVAFEQKKQVTAVPLKLAPAESVFVVFLKPARQTKVNHIETNYPAFELVDDFKEPWTVNFNTAFRGPAKPVIFESLIDWTTSSDDRIKYYSGTAFYHNTFTIDLSNKNNRFMIDLGALTAMAKVIVNGVYAGGVWTTPYRLDITDFVKNGKNEVKIELVNNWMNRIIGDQKLPEKERATWCFVQPYTAISPLQPSGLFGPVQVLSVKY